MLDESFALAADGENGPASELSQLDDLDSVTAIDGE